MDEALEFLKSKGMIIEPCTAFEITGKFGTVNLVELLNEFKNQK